MDNDAEPIVRITMRDLYDRIGTLESSLVGHLSQHEDRDDERFDSLNLKVYGVLATVVASGLAILVNISGIHLT